MEEDMQFFVSTKAGVTDELRGQLGKLKSMYGSGIKALNDIAGELNGTSQLTFSDLNSEVSKHSSDLKDLFKGIASEADELLNDLQSSIHNQADKITEYAQQQREAQSRAVEITRSISKTAVNFFETLDMHASRFTQMVEEAKAVNVHKLSELEKKFEECTANEEKQLLEKVAELLATSNAKKKKLVQMAVHDLQEAAVTRTSKLQQELSTMQNSTCSVKAECAAHMERIESNYIVDTFAVESGKKDLDDIVKNCLKQAKLGVHQWHNAQESLLNLEMCNVASVDSIARRGMEASQTYLSRFSSATTAANDDVDVANKQLLSRIDNSLQLDHDACSKLNSVIVPCCGEIRQLKGSNYHQTVEIKEIAGKCLLDEYMVDEPSCSTPRKRSFNLPSIASIEELRTPTFDELLKYFWDARSAKEATGDVNGDVKHISTAHEAVQSLRDSRLPLTTIN